MAMAPLDPITTALFPDISTLLFCWSSKAPWDAFRDKEELSGKLMEQFRRSVSMPYSHADLSEQDEETAGGWQSNESKVSSVTLPTTMWTSDDTDAIVVKQTQARFNANARTDIFIDGVIDVKWSK